MNEMTMAKQVLGKGVVLALACVRLSASAGAFDNVVIDEYGVGKWVDSEGSLISFSGVQDAPDPSGGTLTALVYTTPFTFSVQGDYEIYTPDTHELAGIVRFYGNNTMIFYDNDVGIGSSPADRSGLPAARMAFVLGLEQTLVGDPSSTVVTPTDGMAGFDGGDRQYTFLSVYPVPEPGLASLLASGLVCLALRRRRRVPV